MSFQKLTAIAGAAPKNAPVTMRLTKGAAVVIHINKSFIGDGWDASAWQRADVFIGDGEHAGKLLVEPSAIGLVKVAHLKHAMIINIGRIPSIGQARTKSWPADAQLLDGAVEVTIPDLPAAEDDEQTDDDADNSEDEVTDDDDGTDVAPPPATKSRGDTFDGITVDLTDGEEQISFRGVTAEVTKRQAKYLFLLAKERPGVILDRIALNALWDGRPPSHAIDVMMQIVNDLDSLLAPLKLAVRAKGTGHQLVEL